MSLFERALRLARSTVLASTALLLAFAPALRAQQQQRDPHLGYVYPAGGRQGVTLQVTLGGQFLDGASDVYVSGSGVSATVIEHEKASTPKELEDLRDKLKALTDKYPDAFPALRRRLEAQESKKAAKQAEASKTAPVDETKTKPDAPVGSRSPEGPGAVAGKEPDAIPRGLAGMTPEDRKLADELRQRLAKAFLRPVNPAIGETVWLEVKLAPDATPGEREIRLGTALGLTNPLVFQVGQLPEFSAEPAKVIAQRMPPPKAPDARGAQREPEKTEMAVTLPAVVNGQILPGKVDRFRFAARKGQHLTIVAAARRLIPYLPDAVPGWFQATLALYDAQGHELAYDDDYRFDPDPVLSYVIPADGEYAVEIKDAVYRGREDFVYRVTIGELPFVTGLFPLGGRVGERVTTEMDGWNLPSNRAKLDLAHAEPGIHPITLRAKDRVLNSLPFATDTLPERREKEPNDDLAHAQQVSLPVVVNGRVDRPEDKDVFRFEGRAGETVVGEVLARRLGSPLDSVLRLTDAAGKELAFNDDHEDKGAGLTTHHADSWLMATLPANGTYYLELRDVQGKGGEDYGYRLRISAPRPDFELRVVPASVNARPGTTVPITVYALRRDGFSGDVALELKDAPPEFALSGAWVPAGQEKVRLTLTVPPVPLEQPVSLQLEGRAVIQGKEVRRRAVPAEDMMQAFVYHHLVPERGWLVEVAPFGPQRRAAIENARRAATERRELAERRAVAERRQLGGRGQQPLPGRPGGGAWQGQLQRGPERRTAELLDDKPVKLRPGGTADVRFAVPRGPLASQVQLELSEPPEGISIANLSTAPGSLVVRLSADGEKTKPGLKGNLILEAFVERVPNGPDGKPQGEKRRQPVGALPAVPFETTAR